MGKIVINKIEDFPEAVFEVEVNSDNPTVHKVTLEENYYKKLTNGKITPEEFTLKSFDFLLSRESNSSILTEFNLNQISSYFPEYEDEIVSSV